MTRHAEKHNCRREISQAGKYEHLKGFLLPRLDDFTFLNISIYP
jgi:hypothetical protein